MMVQTSYNKVRDRIVEDLRQKEGEKLAKEIASLSADEFIEKMEKDNLVDQYQNRNDLKQLKSFAEDEVGFKIPEGVETQREIAYHLSRWINREKEIQAVRIDDEESELWVYNKEKSTWSPTGRQKVREIVRKQTGAHYSTHLRKETEENLKGIKPIPSDKAGPEKREVPFKNKILDVKDWELRDIEKEDYIKDTLPVKYKPQQDCSKFKKYLREVVPNHGDRRKLQEFTGYCLMNWTAKYEKALVLIGPTNSGKSVFLDILRELFGEENVSNQSLQYLAHEKWGINQLEGKYLNIRHDLTTDRVERTGIFKELVSGNPVKAESKNGKLYDLKPTAKLIFSANQMPPVDDPEDAFWNRWLVVPFPNSIPKKDQDKNLLDKLTTEDELQGILNWALKGLKRLRKQQEFTRDLSIGRKQKTLYGYGDSCQKFIHSRIVLRNDATRHQEKEYEFKEHFKDIYSEYEDFADGQGCSLKSKKKLSSKLQKLPGVDKRKLKLGGNQNRGFTGLAISEQ